MPPVRAMGGTGGGVVEAPAPQEAGLTAPALRDRLFASREASQSLPEAIPVLWAMVLYFRGG